MNSVYRFVRRHREFSLLMLDTVAVIVSYLLAYLIRMDFSLSPPDFQSAHFRAILLFLPVVILLNWAVLGLLKVNRSLWEYIGIDEIIRVCVSAALSNGVWFLVVLAAPIPNYIRSVPAIAAMLQMFLMLSSRRCYRLWRRSQMQKDRVLRALIIGAGSAGNILLRELIRNPVHNCRVIGFVDDAPSKWGKTVSGLEILGSTADLADIARKQRVNIVYIAIPSAGRQRISEVIQLCNDAKLKTRIMDYSVIDQDEIGQNSIRDVSIDDLLGRGEIHLDNSEIGEYLSGKVVMVTGGGGSIGSELCRQILPFGPRQLIVMDIYENNKYALQQEIIMAKRQGKIGRQVEVICLIGSVRDRDRLDHILGKYHPDVLFHAAAHKHVPLVEDSPKEAVKNNVFGTYHTLMACIENRVGKFILISTDKAVNPTNVMGATKRMCELIVQSMRNNGVTKIGAVRFGNVLGSNGSVIPLFKEQIRNGGPVTVTDPEITRYFMTIPEAAQLVLQAGAYANEGDIFVLDMGRPVKILKLAEDLIRLSGLEPYKDIDIVFTGLRPGEKMYEELALGNEKRHKTANNLIYVNEPMEISREEIRKKLEKLKRVTSEQNNQDVRKLILEIID